MTKQRLCLGTLGNSCYCLIDCFVYVEWIDWVEEAGLVDHWLDLLGYWLDLLDYWYWVGRQVEYIDIQDHHHLVFERVIN